MNALFIVPALKGDEAASLFSTHPSIEERVAQLNEMQRQMEQAHYDGPLCSVPSRAVHSAAASSAPTVSTPTSASTVSYPCAMSAGTRSE